MVLKLYVTIRLTLEQHYYHLLAAEPIHLQSNKKDIVYGASTVSDETRLFSTEVFYNIQAVSSTMYDLYAIPFVIIGYILLTAMLGAIVLAMYTLEMRPKKRIQTKKI